MILLKKHEHEKKGTRGANRCEYNILCLISSFVMTHLFDVKPPAEIFSVVRRGN